jgi:hypothetical protein
LIAPPELAGEVEEASALTVAAHYEAGEDAVYRSPQQVFVATPDLAGDDRWPEHLLGVMVGGRHVGLVQEHQPLAAMCPDMVV